MIRPSARVLLVAAGILAAGCGGAQPDTIDVLAASSYTDVGEPLEELLESELGIDVEFSFGSSGSFLEQIRQGAPASVVITADSATMQRIDAAGLIDSPVALATNELVVVTADTDAGSRIGEIDDLTDRDAVVVLCASSAPCGAATDLLLDHLDIDIDEASREPNVRATLTKVRLGEADAAIVYRTDALASPDLRRVDVPAESNVTVTGQAAAVSDSERGTEVLAALTGSAAEQILLTAGFGSP